MSCMLTANTHLLGDNMSFPHMGVDGVQRRWQEQVLTLTVERLTLMSKEHTPKNR